MLSAVPWFCPCRDTVLMKMRLWVMNVSWQFQTLRLKKWDAAAHVQSVSLCPCSTLDRAVYTAQLIIISASHGCTTRVLIQEYLEVLFCVGDLVTLGQGDMGLSVQIDLIRTVSSGDSSVTSCICTDLKIMVVHYQLTLVSVLGGLLLQAFWHAPMEIRCMILHCCQTCWEGRCMPIPSVYFSAYKKLWA